MAVRAKLKYSVSVDTAQASAVLREPGLLTAADVAFCLTAPTVPDLPYPHSPRTFQHKTRSLLVCNVPGMPVIVKGLVARPVNIYHNLT